MNFNAKRILIRNKDDYEAAVYFIKNDKRSDKKYIQPDKNTLIISNETEKLLRDINIPFYIQDNLSSLS
jgi:hypothetical protein